MADRRESVKPWRSLRELSDGAGTPARDEFPPEADQPMDVPSEGLSRRRFLGLMGATAALAGTAGCTRPDKEEAVVPYTRRPEEIVPGVANYYASTWQEGSTAHGVLVKTREGRPIHLEGNDQHPGARGKLSPRAQAQILSLYDPDRLRQPLLDGQPGSWDQVVSRLGDGLRQARSQGRQVLLLTGAVLSPTQRQPIEWLRRVLPALRHVAWEPVADHAARAAAERCYGEALAPRFRLDKARVILSLENDFLGGDDPALIHGFAASRRVKDRHDSMSRLYAVEGRMSLTGSNADVRLPMRPLDAAGLAFTLARVLHEEHGLPLPQGVDPAWLSSFTPAKSGRMAALAADLAGARREALVLVGPALPVEGHVAGHLLNAMLEADGNTVETATSVAMPELATPEVMHTLAEDMDAGKIGAAILWNVNPCYALADAERWKQALGKVPLRAALSLTQDETASECQLTLPINHWLESWGDFEPALDLLSLQQPVIAPLHDTRQAEDILLRLTAELSGVRSPGYRSIIRRRWAQEVRPADSPLSLDAFWNAALHDGVLARTATPRPPRQLDATAVSEAARGVSKGALPTAMSSSEPALLLHPDAKLYDGRYADNGWLQEMPEPLAKTVWGNALAVSPADAGRQGIEDGDLVEVSAGSRSLRLPALIQPGQCEGVLSVALGYGRESGSVGSGVGTNAYALLDAGSDLPYLFPVVSLSKVGGKGQLVRTQEHHSLHGRELVLSRSLAEYAHHGLGHASHHPEGDLYEKVEFPGHHWGMVIDNNACVGCNACVMACQSENNIPVVGPEQVERGREMHWIRIDTYHEGPPDNPAMVHQPMLCQHCDKAPCENVCPVNATTHSPEGLNQMAYNRCVGTRYCANNCPFKVRRFNFFDNIKGQREPLELLHNPEVSLRPRGVMEKCTFCVQRIEDGKMRAKLEGRKPADGEIRPACAAACPAEAIVFGDRNDEKARVTDLWRNDRGYRVLEAELGIDPSITYLARLRNTTDDGDSHE